MSIASEITRINSNIAAAYTAAENKGATMPPTNNSAHLADTINSIPRGGSDADRKDVNFYDYDGTLLHSYTAQEAQALLSLPPLPSHSGLIAQQWNWTLEDIQSYLGTGREITVGCNYDTDDGTTKLYLFVEKGTRIQKLSINIGLNKLSSATVYWGDGTSSVLENPNQYVSMFAAVKTDYAEASEDTEICVTISGAFAYLGNGANGCSLYYGGDTPIITSMNIGSKCGGITNYGASGLTNVVSISLPSNLKSFSSNSFRNCYNLRFLTVPRGTSRFYDGSFFANYRLEAIAIPVTLSGMSMFVFQNCYALRSVMLPDAIRTFDSSVFSACYAMRSYVLPANLTSIQSNAFQSNIMLRKIKIPANVTSIGGYSFSSCDKLYEVDLTAFTDPSHIPTLGYSVFNYTPESMTFYFASQAMLDAFSAATNWSSYADQFEVRGDTV